LVFYGRDCLWGKFSQSKRPRLFNKDEKGKELLCKTLIFGNLPFMMMGRSGIESLRYGWDAQKAVGELRMLVGLTSEAGKKLNDQVVTIIGGDDFGSTPPMQLRLHVKTKDGRQLRVRCCHIVDLEAAARMKQRNSRPVQESCCRKTLLQAIKHALDKIESQPDSIIEHRNDCKNRYTWLKVLKQELENGKEDLSTWKCGDTGPLNVDDVFAKYIHAFCPACLGDGVVKVERFSNHLLDHEDDKQAVFLMSKRFQEFIVGGRCERCQEDIMEAPRN